MFQSPLMCEKNGSREPYLPHWGLFVIHTLGLVTINVCAKFEVSIVTSYDNTKGNAKCIKYTKIAHKRHAIGKRPSRTLKVIAIR